MREIKSRIKGIKDIKQMTKAMNLISAAKLKKARLQLDQALPYFTKVKTTIADILMHSGNIDNTVLNGGDPIPVEKIKSNAFFDERPDKSEKTTGIVIFTGDKGLAGGYNHNIIKLAEELISEFDNPRLFVAGHLGRSYFVRKHYNVCEEFFYPVQNPTVYRARDIADYIIDLFKTHELDEVYVIYTEMVSSIKLEPKKVKLLPLNLDLLKEDIGYDKHELVKTDDMIKYEPSPRDVFNVLISKYVKGIIYGALVEAFTSEQTARMTAMDNATANADEMLHKLNLHYNRARQAAITQEISEIVGGASALE